MSPPPAEPSIAATGEHAADVAEIPSPSPSLFQSAGKFGEHASNVQPAGLIIAEFVEDILNVEAAVGRVIGLYQSTQYRGVTGYPAMPPASHNVRGPNFSMIDPREITRYLLHGGVIAHLVGCCFKDTHHRL